MPASNQACLTSYFASLKTDILLHGTVQASISQHLFLNHSTVIVLLKQVTEVEQGHFLSHYLSLFTPDLVIQQMDSLHMSCQKQNHKQKARSRAEGKHTGLARGDTVVSKHLQTCLTLEKSSPQKCYPRNTIPDHSNLKETLCIRCCNFC